VIYFAFNCNHPSINGSILTENLSVVISVLLQLYHSAFSYNSGRFDTLTGTTTCPTITAYPCEVSYDALIQTNSMSIERLVSTNQISMLLESKLFTMGTVKPYLVLY
jgi:hypothetical protein